MITNIFRRLPDYLILAITYLLVNLPLIFFVNLVFLGGAYYLMPGLLFVLVPLFLIIWAVILWQIIKEMVFSGDFNEDLVCPEYSDGNGLKHLASSYGMHLPEDWHNRLQSFSSDNGIESASHGFKARFIWERDCSRPNGRAPARGNIHLCQLTALCYLCSDEHANVYRISQKDCMKIHAKKDTFEKAAKLIAYHECGHKVCGIPFILLFIFPFLSLINECFAEMYAVKVSGYSREMIRQLYDVRAFAPPDLDISYLSFNKLRDFLLRGSFTEKDIRDIARARHAFPPGVWFTIRWFRNHGLFIESAYS